MSIDTKNISDSILNLRDTAKNLKVLFVEDDPLIRKEYLNFLGRFFLNIDVRENGLEGLQATQEKSYDILFSDIEMPKMNGLDMIEKIKEQNSNQVSILISAHQESDILYRSISLGVDGYLFKPLDAKQTIKLLCKIVDNIHIAKRNRYYQEELESLVVSKTQEVIKTFTIDKITGLFSLAKLQQDFTLKSLQSIALLKVRGFKNLNDFYGYEIGNSVLLQTANILKQFSNMKKENFQCILYRVGGAHFSILTDMQSDQLVDFIQEFVTYFEHNEIEVDGETIFFEIDAGIVDNSCITSLSNADKALRQSEKNGDIVLYKDDPIMLKRHKVKLQYKDMIKRALNESRFIPYYQPIINNQDKTIKKYEALVRMVSPEGEIISPLHFLSIAKETKMYSEITKEVIKKVFHDFRDSQCNVSINLSIDDIKNSVTRDFLRQKIMGFNEPGRIIFEILETEQIDSYETLKEFITEMKTFGCKIAIDDFGSGYSNFEHLVELNVDFIKIDGSLIGNIDTNKASQIIVEMLSQFALKMGIGTIAEFVSRSDIKNVVESMGINESQGYFYSQPVPFDQTMRKMRQLAII